MLNQASPNARYAPGSPQLSNVADREVNGLNALARLHRSHARGKAHSRRPAACLAVSGGAVQRAQSTWVDRDTLQCHLGEPGSAAMSRKRPPSHRLSIRARGTASGDGRRHARRRRGRAVDSAGAPWLQTFDAASFQLCPAVGRVGSPSVVYEPFEYVFASLGESRGIPSPCNQSFATVSKSPLEHVNVSPEPTARGGFGVAQWRRSWYMPAAQQSHNIPAGTCERCPRGTRPR
jgi:hypothetical protein